MFVSVSQMVFVVFELFVFVCVRARVCLSEQQFVRFGDMHQRKGKDKNVSSLNKNLIFCFVLPGKYVGFNSIHKWIITQPVSIDMSEKTTTIISIQSVFSAETSLFLPNINLRLLRIQTQHKKNTTPPST